MNLIHLLVLGILFILRAGESITIPDTSSEEPPFADEEHELPSRSEDEKMESGIVFLNRGSVLLTGEDWIVAKEFNITDVASLVNEAKSLFPSISKRLQNSIVSEGENIWDLQFFRESINQEIDVIGPIINKIEEKIQIFENMLPKDDEDDQNSHPRKKRFLWAIFKAIGGAIGHGLGKLTGRALFGYRNKRELQELNRKYNAIIDYQKQQKWESEMRKLELKYIVKDLDQIETDMRNAHDAISSLKEEQKRDMAYINTKLDETIDNVLNLENKVNRNTKKISKLEYNFNILKAVHERRINSINQTVTNLQKDVKEVKGTLIKHYTIMQDLDMKTEENRRNIYDVKKELAYTVRNWRWSQKQIIEKLNMVVNITSTMRMMEIQLLSIDTYLTGLLEALDTVATGRLSPNLISPTQLVEILKDMEDNLPTGVYPLTLIKEDAVYEYYTYADVYAIAIPGAIRVFIKLPLKTPKRMFHLLQPYPLPFYHEDASVFLQIAKPADFVLVSYDKQKVAEIPDSVLQECKSKNNMFLCASSFPMYEGRKCSLNLVKQDPEEIINSCERSVVIPNFKSKWIRAQGGWIYSVSHMTSLTFIRNSMPVAMDTISGTGFLKDIPQTFTYADDGTVLFPNDKLGDNGTNAFNEGQIFVPAVPNLLLLSESTKIAKSELEDIIEELKKSNTGNTEKINLYSILKHTKEALFAEAPETSGSALVPVLIVAMIVNYTVLVFVCWSRANRSAVASKKKNLGLVHVRS